MDSFHVRVEEMEHMVAPKMVRLEPISGTTTFSTGGWIEANNVKAGFSSAAQYYKYLESLG